tara:strand:- start:1849 stop:2559 length:711 start_codon:yes stop_codon:yes gene_type:complete
MDYNNKKNELTHVAFIMDGNRRWAKKNGLPVVDGHKMGSQVIKKIVKKSLKLKIKYLTFYSFSTENWNRDPLEVNDLQNLLKFYLDSEVENFIKNKIKFKVIGDITSFNKSITNRLNKIINLTRDFNDLYFILALSYGSRNEIINGINRLIKTRKNSIKEEIFTNFLMTKDIPDPDLVIRTSGEMRISNFLLWQIAYSELYFTKTLWPDFNSSKYQQAINNFIKRKRRFGKDHILK